MQTAAQTVYSHGLAPPSFIKPTSVDRAPSSAKWLIPSRSTPPRKKLPTPMHYTYCTAKLIELMKFYRLFTLLVFHRHLTIKGYKKVTYSNHWPFYRLPQKVCVCVGGGAKSCFHTRARQRQDNKKTTRQMLNLCIPLWCLSHQTCRTWCERHHSGMHRFNICLLVVFLLSCRCLALVWKHH